MSTWNSDTIPEADWKILRELKPDLLERFCRAALSDMAPLLEPEPGEAHSRFLELYQRLHEHNDRLADAFDGMRRSRAKEQLSVMRKFGLLTDEELGRFSEETREYVARFMGSDPA